MLFVEKDVYGSEIKYLMFQLTRMTLRRLP